MMINFNGNIYPNDAPILSFSNRSFLYGDAVFETIKYTQKSPLFWEDHYFRLMSAMRIMRMEIPLEYTPDYFLKQFEKTISSQEVASDSWRLRLTVFRNDGGRYTPHSNTAAYVIQTEPHEQPYFELNKQPYLVDLFKDFYVHADMLSNLKTTNKALQVIGSVYAKENDLDNCILMNSQKQVVEFLNGNLFLVKDNELMTPPLQAGCLNGILRKQIFRIADQLKVIVREVYFSPFELQKGDELWLTNTQLGIQTISNYRRKKYKFSLANRFITRLNTF